MTGNKQSKRSTLTLKAEDNIKVMPLPPSGKLPLKLSQANLCDYIPDQRSQVLFTHIDSSYMISKQMYKTLSYNGFRRSGHAFYKPFCKECMQCISCRVVVEDFKLSRRFRKVLNRNAQVGMTTKPAHDASQENYSLYQRYIAARHADGNMYPPSLQTFEQYLSSSPASTVFIEFRDHYGKLVAVAVTDKLEDGLSSIYTFFDPDPSYNSRSLGVFSILKQIEIAQDLDLPYVYLGYWIPSVRKMNYKTEYTPIELLINGQWQRFDIAPDQDDIINCLHSRPVQIKE